MKYPIALARGVVSELNRLCLLLLLILHLPRPSGPPDPDPLILGLNKFFQLPASFGLLEEYDDRSSR